ncbi:MAG: hypothetical protein ONB23_08930 [candidate division KSB1 bacterium]|nr:hypothetical protein [candidate division KSB1 bacterium]
MKLGHIAWCVGFALSLIAFAGGYRCAHRPKGPEVAIIPFEFEGQKYRLRSVYSRGEGESFNELIGPDFVARDEDQDGVLDAVTMGEGNLVEAQRIYDWVLSSLAAQNKLRRIEPANATYRYEERGLRFQIKTIAVEKKGYVNEFTVSRVGWVGVPELVVAIDQGADGQLDQVVRGTLLLQEAQRLYAGSIERGLVEKRLVRQDSLILVRR